MEVATKQSFTDTIKKCTYESNKIEKDAITRKNNLYKFLRWMICICIVASFYFNFVLKNVDAENSFDVLAVLLAIVVPLFALESQMKKDSLWGISSATRCKYVLALSTVLFPCILLLLFLFYRVMQHYANIRVWGLQVFSVSALKQPIVHQNILQFFAQYDTIVPLSKLEILHLIVSLYFFIALLLLLSNYLGFSCVLFESFFCIHQFAFCYQIIPSCKCKWMHNVITFVSRHIVGHHYREHLASLAGLAIERFIKGEKKQIYTFWREFHLVCDYFRKELKQHENDDQILRMHVVEIYKKMYLLFMEAMETSVFSLEESQHVEAVHAFLTSYQNDLNKRKRSQQEISFLKEYDDWFYDMPIQILFHILLERQDSVNVTEEVISFVAKCDDVVVKQKLAGCTYSLLWARSNHLALTKNAKSLLGCFSNELTYLVRLSQLCSLKELGKTTDTPKITAETETEENLQASEKPLQYMYWLQCQAFVMKSFYGKPHVIIPSAKYLQENFTELIRDAFF